MIFSIMQIYYLLILAFPSASPLTIPPQISQESLLRNQSPMNRSFSKTSIDKLNDARYDTKAGIICCKVSISKFVLPDHWYVSYIMFIELIV